MQRWHAFQQLILARVREFYREPEAIFWVYGFPLILALILGLAFAAGQTEAPHVDVQAEPDAAHAEKVAATLRSKGLKVAVLPEKECQARLAHGKTSLYLIPGVDTFVYDATRTESVLARKWVETVLLQAKLGASSYRERLIEEPGSRYIDFLLPGLIGMNIMGGGLFGVGFVLVDLRVRKLFKRFLATPMHRGDFLAALLSARLLFLLPEMIALLLLGRFAFGVPLRGSLLCLLAVILLGALAFAGIGLLVGSRTEKLETISGFINLVMLPMYLLSGIFFPSSRFPDWAQPLIQALPLTQLNNALREVMLEGAGWTDIAGRLGILALWAAGSFLLALRWFRWR